MSDSFDCPKCGAPLTYNAQEQGYKETITCSYCGESVIVPADLRQKPETLNPMESFTGEPVVIDLNQIEKQVENAYGATLQNQVETGKAVGRSVSSCIIVSLIITAVVGIIAVAIFLGVFSAFFRTPSFSPTQSRANFSPQATAAPMPTDIAPPTPASPATDEVKTSAPSAADLKLTQTALNTLVLKQNSWPVVLQEKFVNNKINWGIANENTDRSILSQTISGGKYTWKVTSKKSVGEISYPDMAVLTDMLVSVDIQMTDSKNDTDDQAGIVFRVSDKDQTFYFFGVSPAGGYSLSYYDGSGWNDLIPSTNNGKIKSNSNHHMAVSIQGTKIILMIDNVIVDSIEDTQYDSGTAGLGLYISSPGAVVNLTYSNFLVRSPKK